MELDYNYYITTRIIKAYVVCISNQYFNRLVVIMLLNRIRSLTGSGPQLYNEVIQVSEGRSHYSD
jgi:hypothetical protein